MTRTPLLLVGDGPAEPSGLGRILRDLASQIVASDLPVDLATVGESLPGGWDLWPHISMGAVERAGDWGAAYVEQVWRARFGDRPGILWVIWDPSRLAAYHRIGQRIPVQLWSYPAIDAETPRGRIGGPGGEAVREADRVIAYGRWASTILKAERGGRVAYLPHGISPMIPDNADDWVQEQIGPHWRTGQHLIGCVATNQPRKDLGLYCQTLAELRQRGHKVYGWLHTDTLVKAWSVPQLVEECGLQKRLTVTHAYTDPELAALYRACGVTIAPGLGEGFGYPIVESLAQGTPVVHGDGAGGRELVPRSEWRFPIREERLEGCYALRRPVFRASDVANAIERVWAWQAQLGEAASRAYCRGAVAHLDWRALWPRWYAWIKQGLEG